MKSISRDSAGKIKNKEYADSFAYAHSSGSGVGGGPYALLKKRIRPAGLPFPVVFVENVGLVIKLLVILFFFQTWLLQAQQPVTLFCHGIVDNKTQADRYNDFLQEPTATFDFPDAQEPSDWNFNNFVFCSCALFGKSPVNLEKMYMGHGPDIQTLQNQIDSEKSYILYGLSRGGATAISYLAQHNPDNVRALILDAAPADMVATIDTLQYLIGYKFAPERSTQEAFFHTLFPAYPMNSTPAVCDIANIHNKNLPIFIAHSHDDARVSIASAWQLYQAFKQAGFTHVYLCELTTGVHAHYMEGPEKDLYLRALHSFYKQYNLAYNANLANLDLEQLQPTQQEVSEKLAKHQENLELQYQHMQTQIKYAVSAAGIIILATMALYHFKHQI